jgi:exonuclease III
MISVHFQGKPFSITVIQVYSSTSNAEAAKVEWFYEDLHDRLELTPKKDVLFIIGDWNAKVGSQ